MFSNKTIHVGDLEKLLVDAQAKFERVHQFF